MIKEIFKTMDYGPAPESSDNVHTWLERHNNRFGLFVGGKWTKPGEVFETINPSNGKVIAEVTQASDKDVDAAVKAARKAYTSWSKLPGHSRARYIYALARQIQKHSRLFAVLEALDNGKPVRETRDIDIPLVVRHFYHHAGWAQLMESELVGYESIGVCGQIIPWNFPLLMLAWKIAPALAMGNTIVLKPAELTPLTALLFGEICQEIGLPQGVVNIITGDGSTGELLIRHPQIDKLAFTGSTEVGKLIREVTAGSGKKLSLELGGKSPFIVFDDADLDSVVEGVVDAIWFNQGQVCCAGSRLLVQEGIARKLTDKLRNRMETLRVGEQLDKSVDMGAIVAPQHLEKIKCLVEQGKAEGATCWQPSWAVPQEGCFFPPTLFTEVSPTSIIAQLEIFGPVLTVMTFRTPAEAVELANNTRYGLAASVWSENINLALDIAAKLKAGVVWVNSSNLFDAAAGFGGYRESGFGREGGLEGLYEYVKPLWEKKLKNYGKSTFSSCSSEVNTPDSITIPLTKSDDQSEILPIIDRTAKMYIGGKQVRPDSGYSLRIHDTRGRLVGQVGEGNRKDIRNAVEAARKAANWTQMTAHHRAQILYFLAENMQVRASEFETRLISLTGVTPKRAAEEVALSIERVFSYSAWTDKYDGYVHRTPMRNVTLSIPEALGIVGVVCPIEAPLLAFVSLVIPAVAMGNRVIAVPSAQHALIATDFYQILDTSDIPSGVINIVTGMPIDLTSVLAQHDEIDAMWYVGSQEGSTIVERESVGNLKQTWVNHGKKRDWFDPQQGAGRDYLRRATQVKNIWVPYGE